MGRSSGCGLSLLIEGQLLVQTEVLHHERGAWAQVKAQEPQRITEEHQQRAYEPYERGGIDA